MGNGKLLLAMVVASCLLLLVALCFTWIDIGDLSGEEVPIAAAVEPAKAEPMEEAPAEVEEAAPAETEPPAETPAETPAPAPTPEEGGTETSGAAE
jgi:hypothetical protein